LQYAPTILLRNNVAEGRQGLEASAFHFHI